MSDDPQRWCEDASAEPELRGLVEELRATERPLPLPAALRERALRPPRSRVWMIAAPALIALGALAVWGWPPSAPTPRAEIAPVSEPMIASEPVAPPEPAAMPDEGRPVAPAPAPRRARAAMDMPPAPARPIQEALDDPIDFELPVPSPPARVRAALLRCYAPWMGVHDVRVVAELRADGSTAAIVEGAPAPLTTCLRRRIARTPPALSPEQPVVTFDLALGIERATSGRLSLRTDPPAHVFLDGRYTGLRTPFRERSLPAGTHDLTLTSDDGRSFTVHVELHAGGHLELDRPLEL